MIIVSFRPTLGVIFVSWAVPIHCCFLMGGGGGGAGNIASIFQFLIIAHFIKFVNLKKKKILYGICDHYTCMTIFEYHSAFS